MGLFQNLIQKAVKPVGGNAFFESFGVPGATNLTDQINSYKGVVYACVSAIAEEVGKMEIKTMRGGVEVITPLTALLQNPNPDQRMTQYNLIELTQTYIELSGECFWYLATGETSKQPKQIYILRPDRMSVVLGENGKITGYKMRKEDGTNVPFEVSEIIHFKMPNPMNPYRGLGTVSAGMTYIQTETFASEWTRNSFYNDASPRGIVSLKGTITQPEFDAVKRKWNKEYGGIKNANKTAILKGIDIDYTKIGSGLNDVAIKELKGMTRDDIMFMFRVSKPILGIVEDVNYANAKSSNFIFMQRVIKPKMDRIADTLQSALGNFYGITITFEDPVEEDDMEKANYYEKLLNVGMTINEVREELGKDPISNGDSIYQPVNLISVGEVVPVNRSVKLTQRKTTKKKTVKEEHNHDAGIAQKPDIKYIHWKNLNSIENSWLKRINEAIDKVLKMQKKDVMDQLKPKRKKDVTGYEPDKKKYAEIWSLTITPIMNEMMKEIGTYASSIITRDYTPTQQMQQDLAKRISKAFTDFDLETADALSKSLLEGITSEASLADLSARVDVVFQTAMGYRADRIAVTETHKTANFATLDAYKQSSVVTGKEWYTNPGACGFCEEMNGKIVDLNANFLDLGASVEYMDDEDVAQTMGISYEPIATTDLHPNCQCTLLPWSSEFESTGQFLEAIDETVV